MAAFISIALLFTGYAALIFYYRQSWIKIPVFKSSEKNTSTKISVIIPARNEEKNIKNCIQSILSQTYSTHLFEIIIIDDFSTDNTVEIIKLFQENNIELIELKNHITENSINSYKKKAIEIGIGQSTGDLIVTTDADCIMHPNWLQTIAEFYEKTEATFIAMPVKYSGIKNFLTIFQALDFITLQGITGASVYKKFHSMCNGANLAYTKKAFYEVNGFKGIDNMASGDDMLLMHKIYKQSPDKIFFLKSKDVIVSTQPMHTMKQFFNQRIRWASKADRYDDKRIFVVLLIVYFLNIILFILPIIALFKNIQLSIINYQLSIFSFWLIIILFKTITELTFLYPVAKFFNQQKLLWWFPLAQPFHILYTIIAGGLGKFGSYHWKDRKVK